MKKQYVLTIVSLSLMIFSQNLMAQETAFHFRLILPGESANSSAVFSEASGLGKELQTEIVDSGGENSFKYKLPKNSTYNNLVLKRGMVNKNSDFIKWCLNNINGTIETTNISLLLQNEAGQAVKSWSFKNAYPVKCSLSNSSETMVLLESIEIAYSYFSVQ